MNTRARAACTSLLLALLPACAMYQSVRLPAQPHDGAALGRITIEDVRPEEVREARIDEGDECVRRLGDGFLKPSKVEYLRALLAEKLPGKVTLRLESFETNEHCTASVTKARKAGMFGLLGALGAAIAAATAASIPDEDVDWFEVLVRADVNGSPFQFRGTFDYQGMPTPGIGQPSGTEEFQERLVRLLERMVVQLRGTLEQGRPGAHAVAGAALASPSPAAPSPAAPSLPAPPALSSELRRTPAELLRACEAGRADACADLGQLHESGAGVAKDPRRAAARYGQGCEGGSGRACNNLGVLAEEAKEIGRAARLYERGCDAGSPAACLNLGRLHAMGRGVEKDSERAAELYRAACDRGYARGCTALAARHVDGDGVPVDMERARELYAKACKHGDTRACRKQAALPR